MNPSKKQIDHFLLSEEKNKYFIFIFLSILYLELDVAQL